MILKSLELVGFKSFGETTRLDFTTGFTAIVGPNGCGKSNVSDAIRWVIGEQNSRTLRGTKLTDLIFNGSETRKPLNRAEISLVIGNLPKGLRIASVPNLGEEIRVSRLYHRSGESEYYINQVPCRLKDIVDLFLDLGISSRSMTIIEQNHIHEIITAKPEERRSLIEEAAGILKFKHRRHEAQLKLSSAEQNLLRITDILKELGRQTESLKRQASKADRYKRYQTEIKDLQLNLWAKKLRYLKQELGKAEADFSKLTEEKTRLSACNSSFEANFEKFKIAIDEAGEILNKKRVNLQELSNEIAKNEHAIEIRQTQIQTAREDTSFADEEIAEMSQEVETLHCEVKTHRQDLGKVSEEIDIRGQERQNKAESLETSKAEFREHENSSLEMESNLKGLYQQAARRKNELTALETRKQYLQSLEEKMLDEKLQTEKAWENARKQFSELEKQYQERREVFESIKIDHGDVTEKLSICKTGLEEQSQLVNASNETYLTKRSLLDSMKELRNKFEGFQDGVKALMSNNNGDRLPGLREVLVDVLKTSSEYETALEAALGNRIQSVIVNSYNDTVRAINYLKSHQSGRSSFVPIRPKAFQQPPIQLNGNPAVLGKMIDKVNCPEEYRPLLEHLIGNVAVTKDLETALSLHSKPEFEGVVVTQNGELIDSNGIVSGGQSCDTGAGLLSQKREMERLEEKVDFLKQELASELCRRDQLSADLSHMESRLKILQPELSSAELSLADGKRNLEEGQKEIDRLEKKLATLAHEVSTGTAESRELDEQELQLGEELKKLEAQKKERESNLTFLRKGLEVAKQDLETQLAELHDVDILIASLKGKQEIILSEIKRVTLQEQNINHRIDKRQKDKQVNAEKIVGHESAIKDVENIIIESLNEKNRQSEETLAIEEELAEKENALKKTEQEAKVVFKDYQDTLELLSRVEVKRSEKRIESAHLQEQAYNDYSMNVPELLSQYDGSHVDETEVSQIIRELKEKVVRMGEVNLAALSEYQQTQERYTFLDNQQSDLSVSIQTLNQAIEKINQTIQDRFQTTFHQVNEQFELIYARLFHGGKARLVLLDEENPLESGIDIHAQPMGKKMQNLSLLSGGEKAMTAVSLIFSLLKVRPTPFCLLDEVDAPLDEANVVRFQTILQEMADQTQFIIITHNQKTMSFADVLYGVTMEEHGVSKAVSVHLN